MCSENHDFKDESVLEMSSGDAFHAMATDDVHGRLVGGDKT